MTASSFKHPQIQTVSSFDDLVKKPFKGEINAFCWQRQLFGDFKEVVSKLTLTDNMTEIYEEDLLALDLSEAGDTARKTILNDMYLLHDHGALPSLNLIKNYERDDVLDFISTDVYSFHVDHAPVAASTFLCTYFGASGDILPNEEAMQKILIPEIREKLRALHYGNEADFETFLKENYYDLHYEAKSGANPINLGVGNLWRLAVDYPEQNGLPCIHRAPLENDGELRLLLIC